VILATRLALTASLATFLLGNVLGLLLGLQVISYAWRPAHSHLNLLGFVAMMIYGVGYHALPRFAGVPLRRARLALVQVVVAIVALVGMVMSWGLLWPSGVFALWGTLQLVASVLFVGILVEVLWLQRPQSRARPG
jgi:cbb3-type cytochrome oxidase subunit 1